MPIQPRRITIQPENFNPRIDIFENDINLSIEKYKDINLPEEMFVGVGIRIYEIEG